MTTAAPRLAGFAVALAVLFGAGLLAGRLIDPAPPRAAKAAQPETAKDAQPHTADAGHGQEDAMGTMQSTQQAQGEHGAVMEVRGLGVTDDDLRLVVDDTKFTQGKSEQLRFHIADANGERVRDFDVEHTKRMHLIVVRRDLTGFQHLHPRSDGDGNWTTPLTLSDAGAYRMFADFSHHETPRTLATDLTVAGEFTHRDLPAAEPVVSTASGYDVAMKAAGDEMTFAISRAGKPVEAEPYLGANGHLVALREGDLAFLHVHPSGGTTFEATFDTPGRYRLFLQFKVGGKVHTAAFTREVD